MMEWKQTVQSREQRNKYRSYTESKVPDNAWALHQADFDSSAILERAKRAIIRSCRSLLKQCSCETKSLARSRRFVDLGSRIHADLRHVLTAISRRRLRLLLDGKRGNVPSCAEIYSFFFLFHLRDYYKLSLCVTFGNTFMKVLKSICPVAYAL